MVEKILICQKCRSQNIKKGRTIYFCMNCGSTVRTDMDHKMHVRPHSSHMPMDKRLS